MPHSTMSLQSQLLTRSRALADRQGFSATRQPPNTPDVTDGASVSEGEPRGIEGATLGLLDARMHLQQRHSNTPDDAEDEVEGERPSLVVALAEELQAEVLALLPLQSAGWAAQVCTSWRELLRVGNDSLWERLCRRAGHASVLLPSDGQSTSASAEVGGGSCSGDAAGGSSGGSGSMTWHAAAMSLRADEVALASRWRKSTCIEDVLYLHSDHLMSLQLHNGKLISASADHTIRVTDVSGTALREQANAFLSSGAKSFVPRHSVTLTGHGDQVMHAHACNAAGGEDVLASCSADGTVGIWSLGESPALLRQWPKMEAYCVQLDPTRLICGGEGTRPIAMYDWRSGKQLHTFEDDEPPLGVCCSLHRAGLALAAGNTFSRSQLRVWDLPTGAMVDRFTLPAACRGVRCVQLLPEEHGLIAGCANGWIVWCDLRCGRFEKKMAHAECVNSVQLRGGKLVTAADDGLVRITDARNFAVSIGAHRLKRVVFSACCDDERLFAGCDDGTVHMFDYSAAAAAALHAREQGGGFSVQQKEAFGAAIEAARRRANASYSSSVFQ